VARGVIVAVARLPLPARPIALPLILAAPRTLQYVPDTAPDAPTTPPVVLPIVPSSQDLWRAVFGNDAPVEIEIGCGKGTFLVDAAGRDRNHNFLGLERADRLATRAARAVADAGLSNARVLCCDAACVVTQLLPARAVAAYHLYFPDPWWKRRHHKRRVYTSRFAAALSRTLTPGGRVYVATDVGPMLDLIRERFAGAGLVALPESPTPPRTVFARRCGEEGRPVHRAVFARRSVGRSMAAG
jgi:tRNA (guanine-N7-)-methyltransferase